MLVTNNAQFLSLVHEGNVNAPLKSYCDTLLFYYFGHLAAVDNFGDFLEIGIGGSTYPMCELSQIHNRNFNIVDKDELRLSTFSKNHYYTSTKHMPFVIDSTQLSMQNNIDKLIYCHIDGNKNYKVTKSDLEYCLSRLTVNGIICQDDYGNNKWPTVTDAVQDLVYTGKLQILVVGDSSVWLTSPGYYQYWIDKFNSDYEFKLLSKFINLRSSQELGRIPAYLFMQSLGSTELVHDQFSSKELEYFLLLSKYDSESYLKMPYARQSQGGINVISTSVSKYVF